MGRGQGQGQGRGGTVFCTRNTIARTTTHAVCRRLRRRRRLHCLKQRLRFQHRLRPWRCLRCLRGLRCLRSRQRLLWRPVQRRVQDWGWRWGQAQESESGQRQKQQTQRAQRKRGLSSDHQPTQGLGFCWRLTTATFSLPLRTRPAPALSPQHTTAHHSTQSFE